MVNFYEILSEYVDSFAPDYNLITETPSGINIDADSNKGFQKLMWLNVIENGNIGTVNNGLNTTITRNIQIVLFSNCVKEDDGLSYNILKEEIMNDGLFLYNYLNDKLDIDSVNYDTGVDELDQNMVGFEMTFVFEEKLSKCDYFEETKYENIGLAFRGTYWNDHTDYNFAKTMDYLPDVSPTPRDPVDKYIYTLWDVKEVLNPSGTVNHTEYTWKIDDDWLAKNYSTFKVKGSVEIADNYLMPIFITPNDINIKVQEVITGGWTGDTFYDKMSYIYFNWENCNLFKKFVGEKYTLTYWDYKKAIDMQHESTTDYRFDTIPACFALDQEAYPNALMGVIPVRNPVLYKIVKI